MSIVLPSYTVFATTKDFSHAFSSYGLSDFLSQNQENCPGCLTTLQTESGNLSSLTLLITTWVTAICPAVDWSLASW